MNAKTDKIANIIETALKNAGYSYDTNGGTIWIDVDGETYSMTVEKCVDDDDECVCCECGKRLDRESDEYRETDDGQPICEDCKPYHDEELDKVMGNLEDAAM